MFEDVSEPYSSPACANGGQVPTSLRYQSVQKILKDEFGLGRMGVEFRCETWVDNPGQVDQLCEVSAVAQQKQG